MKTAYQKASKPRHIVNGKAFKSGNEAMQYIRDNDFQLERLEKIFKISIYHIKSNPKSTGLHYGNASENEPLAD